MRVSLKYNYLYQRVHAEQNQRNGLNTVMDSSGTVITQPKRARPDINPNQ